MGWSMNVVLAFLCIFCAYLLQRSLYRRFWQRNLAVALTLSSCSAREGERLALFEEISNRKALPLPVLRVKFSAPRSLLFEDQENSQISDQFYRNDILSVMMYQRITRRLDFTCSKRGFYTIGRVDLVGNDIFMSTNLVAVLRQNLQLSVYPRLIVGPEFDVLFRQMFGSVLTRRLINEDPFEFRGIREYQPFDSIKTVNFKASAKTGSLKVNQHACTSSQQVRILLNLEFETIWLYEELREEAIRLASTCACEFLNHGIPVSLYTNGCDLQTAKPVSIPAGSGSGHGVAIDEALARLDTQLRMPPFLPAIAEALKEHAPEETWILISTYQREDFAEAVLAVHGEGVPLFWIAPLHEDMPLAVPYGLEGQVLRWNVERPI